MLQKHTNSYCLVVVFAFINTQFFNKKIVYINCLTLIWVYGLARI
jgi:hypothetical protein